MQFERSSGVLLHISSLPSRGPIGDLGPAAHQFVNFLAAGKQHIWQVLPLSPTGYGNSPYAASSAFAGNPYLISLEVLRDWGWIAADRVNTLADTINAADFDRAEQAKLPLLYEAARNFIDHALDNEKTAAQWDQFEQFCRDEAAWLNDYAYYAVLRREFNTGAWIDWPEPLKRRDPKALQEFGAAHGRDLIQEQVLQFAFALQWDELREAADEHGIRILGDIAIFVNMDSADVWVHPDIFELNENLHPVRVAGVPPDYFSKTGQRWGNPLYKWDALKQRGFDWWADRMRRATQLYDIVRLDHFRGFEAYWAIPAAEETAVNGQWVKGPGEELFKALENALGPLPLVAEDLGMITPEVDALRRATGMPGMKVMQFGFGNKGAHLHLPHRFATDIVAYTGTHDNDTTLGWFKIAGEAEHAAVEAYVGPVGDNPVWPLIRSAETSVASMVVIPAQDLLELGAEARMNTPSVPAGNWSWRAPAGAFNNGTSSAEIAARLAALAEVTDRDNDPLVEEDEDTKNEGTAPGQR
jgi:4-alpha-glucanotransferase